MRAAVLVPETVPRVATIFSLDSMVQFVALLNGRSRPIIVSTSWSLSAFGCDTHEPPRQTKERPCREPFLSSTKGHRDETR